MGLLRYPGGKQKLSDRICLSFASIDSMKSLEYREPFFGGGSIGIQMIKQYPQLSHIWINDLDFGISSLWTSVILYPDMLIEKVKSFIPSIDIYDEYKTSLLERRAYPDNPEDIVSVGFQKLAIHQISYSGLGTKSGGPLGGRSQNSNYKIDCRWSPDYICKQIRKMHVLFLKVIVRDQQCTHADFASMIQDESRQAFLYLDPPYFIKGNDLYQHGFTEKDHIRLADVLRKTKHTWLLSYDDCPEIRELYHWAQISEVNGVSYSITATKDKETGDRKSTSKNELFIRSQK